MIIGGGYMALNVIRSLRKGWHNIGHCDEEMFQEIDYYGYSWKEGNSNYIRMIEIINLYYKENGKIDELIELNRIDKLYVRYDFLTKKVELGNEVYVYFNSLIISIIACVIYENIRAKYTIEVLISQVMVFILMLIVTCIKLGKKGHGGSFKYLVNKYELKLLEDKIEKVHKKLNITDEDVPLLRTKQNVIKSLIRKRIKSVNLKQKKCIDQSIMEIEKINLCLHDYSDCELQEISIDGEKGYLVYEAKGAINNKFKTIDFKILSEELEKNNMLLRKNEFEREM